MRIDTSGLYPNQRPTRNPGETPRDAQNRSARKPAQDSVEVSSGARLLSLGKAMLEDVPDVREGMVEGARRRLSSGAARYDGESIARAMIDTISEGMDQPSEASATGELGGESE